NVNQIQVLLVNAGMVNSKSMTDDYDQTLLGGETSPIKAIAATRPVLIIDEPHRFPRNKVTYKAIEKMKPQLIVRFGVNFPQTTTRSEEHTSELQSRFDLVCRLLLEKKNKKNT